MRLIRDITHKKSLRRKFQHTFTRSTDKRITKSLKRLAIKNLTHGGTRVCITDIIKQLIFVTVRWIIQTTVLLRIKFIRRMLFVGAVGDFELFILIGDVRHGDQTRTDPS